MQVMLFHYKFRVPSVMAPLLDAGWSMQLFFVLSGFVTCYSSEGKYDSIRWGSGLSQLGSRLMRLVPLYYFVILAEWLRTALFEDSSSFRTHPFMGWPMSA